MMKDPVVASLVVAITAEIAASPEIKIIINYLDANSGYKILDIINQYATNFNMPAYRPTNFERETITYNIFLMENFNLLYNFHGYKKTWWI
jgi:hypothetical protein